MSTQQKVFEITEEHFVPQEKLTEQTTFKEICNDSLDVAGYISKIEDAFDISFDSDDLTGVQNIADMIDLVDRYRLQ